MPVNKCRKAWKKKKQKWRGTNLQVQDETKILEELVRKVKKWFRVKCVYLDRHFFSVHSEVAGAWSQVCDACCEESEGQEAYRAVRRSNDCKIQDGKT